MCISVLSYLCAFILCLHMLLSHICALIYKLSNICAFVCRNESITKAAGAGRIVLLMLGP